jgi:hypothetical protein
VATSGNAYSISIGHKENERLIIDCVRGRTGPFNPQQVTAEYADLCRQYRINSVTGDRYAKQWVQQAWRDLLGTYHEANLYASELHLEALAPFNRGLVELPPHLALVREFKSLQRVAGRSGRESVEHPRGCHDDLANSVVGCLRLLSRVERKIPMVAIPDLSKGAVAYNTLNTSGVPSHYLKSGQGAEPWRRFVNADGSISCGVGGAKD